ncbi:MAG: helix-turn-helix domain-containing protein [Pseudonocardiales bacterium]|nr:helix-turn-helix domain-containing protein [Pseudonocardiales bacterium]
MGVPSQSPTALKWWFAVELRRLREKNGLSRDQAAAATKGSPQNIGHIETARTLPKPLELDALLALYRVPERADFFQDMRLRAKKGRDWWVGIGGPMRPGFELLLGIESSAVQIESWDAHVVPGLFQTRATIEALFRGGVTTRSPEELAQRVELRLARGRAVLDREGPPLVWSVLSEGALHWLIGGREVAQAQIEHLIELAERPNVELQVLPFSVGANPGTGGTFAILTAPPELENYAGCVYAEDHIKGHYYEEPEQLTRYRNALTRLRIQATKPEDTKAWLHRLAKDL